MSSTRKLAQLTDIIRDNTAKVDAYIQDKGLPEPSFDASYPPVLQLSPDAEQARQNALEALDELRYHLLGPVGSLVDEVVQLPSVVALHAVAAFNIASSLPDSRPMPIQDLAKTTNMHPSDASRVLHSASTRHIFQYTPEGEITHTSASLAMSRIPAISQTIRMIYEIQWPGIPALVPAMRKWPGAQDPTHSAYSLGRNTQLSFFEHIGQKQEEADMFGGAMTFLVQSPALNPEFVKEYDWGRHKGGVVVDVGGSYGSVAAKILEVVGDEGDLKIIVQDRPEVIAKASRGKYKSIGFMEYDFFTPQPIEDADVYLFRWILHDWSDEYALRILEAVKPGLKEGARVVIMDAITPEPGVLSPYGDRKVRDYDMVMKILFNAKERSEKDWRALFRDADSEGRFVVKEVIRPTGSQLGFIVVEWSG